MIYVTLCHINKCTPTQYFSHGLPHYSTNLAFVLSYNQLNILLVYIWYPLSPPQYFGLNIPCIFKQLPFLYLYFYNCLQPPPPPRTYNVSLPCVFLPAYFKVISLLYLYFLNVTRNYVKQTSQNIYVQHLRENSKSASSKQVNILWKRSENGKRKPTS